VRRTESERFPAFPLPARLRKTLFAEELAAWESPLSPDDRISLSLSLSFSLSPFHLRALLCESIAFPANKRKGCAEYPNCLRKQLTGFLSRDAANLWRSFGKRVPQFEKREEGNIARVNITCITSNSAYSSKGKRTAIEIKLGDFFVIGITT